VIERTQILPTSALPLVGVGVATFMASVSLVGIILAPIINDIKDVKDNVKTMTPLLTLYAQHTSDLDRFKSIEDRITSLIATDDAARNELLHQVHDLESKIVGREENTIHWEQINALTLRVNALSEHCAVKP